MAEEFSRDGCEVSLFNERPEDRSELINRIEDAEVLVESNLPLSAEILSQASELELISVAFTGVDHIDMDYCQQNNITVCNSSGYANQSVAELVIGLSINILRSICRLNTITQEGGKLQNPGQELKGKTVGIIGVGEIGRQVAEITKAFGCNLLGYDAHEDEKVKQLGLDYVNLDTLLKESDIVTIHLPLIESTKNLLGKEKLRLMKDSSILINAARGGIVDYDALSEEIKKENLGGAGIDVYNSEPPIADDHPLFDLPNVITTPHIGYATKESFQRRARIVFENIEKWDQGRPQNVIKY